MFPCRRHVLGNDGERQPDPPEFKTRRWHKANSQTLLLEAWKQTPLGCDGNRRGRAPCRVTFTQTSRTICLIPHCFNHGPETRLLSGKANRIHLHKKEGEKKPSSSFLFPQGWISCWCCLAQLNILTQRWREWSPQRQECDLKAAVWFFIIIII